MRVLAVVFVVFFVVGTRATPLASTKGACCWPFCLFVGVFRLCFAFRTSL